MDSLELNKAFAAVLLAGIAFSGAGLIGGALVKPAEMHGTAIKIDVPEAAGTATASNEPEQPIAALLASADVARGEGQVKNQGCVACHSFNEGGKAGVGPNLYGVMGAPHGHQEGYAYSAVLKGKQGPWTFEAMNEWLRKPATYAPGTKMGYAGLADSKKRADIILYLRSLSKDPITLPAPPPATAGVTPAVVGPASGNATAGAPAGNTPTQQASAPATAATTGTPTPADPNAPIGIRLASADPKAGQADTLKLGCIACHTYNEGGRAGLGPNMYGVVGAPIGSHQDGYQYSAALKGKGGNWTYEELDKWLTKPMSYAPGTKMTFMGVADPKQRADVIAYLRTLSGTPVPLPEPK